MIGPFGIDHGVSKSMPLGIGGMPAEYVRTAVKGAKSVPKLAQKKDKAGHLKRMEGFGAQHRAKGGALHEEVNRPPVWKPKTRAAWDKGFRG